MVLLTLADVFLKLGNTIPASDSEADVDKTSKESTQPKKKKVRVQIERPEGFGLPSHLAAKNKNTKNKMKAPLRLMRALREPTIVVANF